MTVNVEIRKLNPDAVVELFELDLTSIGESDILTFHAGTNNVLEPVWFRGIEYTPWPITASGFEKNTSGKQPRPTLNVASGGGSIVRTAKQFKDFVGAKLIRRRTFVQWLDTEPGPVQPMDPTKELAPDIYRVLRRSNSGGPEVEFELGTHLDLEGVKIPTRIVTQSGCKWRYRGPDCGYTGSNYFDAKDQPVTFLAQDVCGKRLQSCTLRFGQNAVLPYGAFPGAKRYV